MTGFSLAAEQTGVFLFEDTKIARASFLFENFLIFYFPRPNGVSIVRVLHAAQDWWTLLGMK